MRRLRDAARGRTALLVILAAGCLLRVLLLGSRSLWFDEANTLAAASAPLGRLLAVVRTMEGAPPLYYGIIHFWLGFFGDPLLAIRAFSCACGIAALAAFMRWCERLIPGEAAFAGTIAALSSFWIHFSQEGRAYALYLLLVIAASRLLSRLEQDWSPRSAAAYAAACVLGLYTHNFFAFFLLSNFLYLCLRHSSRPRGLLPWLGLYAGVLACYLPWAASLRIQVESWSGISILKAPFTFGELCAMLGTMFFDTSFLSLAHPGLTQALGALVLALVAVSLRLIWSKDRNLAALCAIHVVVPFATVKLLELALGKSMTQARYFMCVSPFLYVALAAGLGGRRVWRGVLAGAMGLGAAAYFASGIFVDTRLADLSAYIRAQADRRRPVVHLASYYYTPMRFYYLPARAHFLAGETLQMINWSALPGYQAVLPPHTLSQLGPCVVVDPARRIFPYRVGVSSGRELARLGLDLPGK